MKQALLSAAVALLLSGCVAALGPAADSPIAAPFDEGDLASILQKGSASIAGQASAQQRDGAVVTAAGAQVLLLPATPYTREAVKKMASGQTQTEANARLRPYMRSTTADAGGAFQFYGLAAGSYLVLIPFRLETEGNSPMQGGALWQEVRVQPGQQVRVAISRKPDGKAVKPSP